MDANAPFDAAAEEAWVAEQRSTIADFFQREGVQHGAIGEWPAWFALLRVESRLPSRT